MKLSTFQIKVWAIYFVAIVLSIFMHEIGHCVVAWSNGIRAIPTPVKEYPMDPVPEALEKYVALGGIVGTIIAAAIGFALYIFRPTKLNSILFAASISSPAMYSLLFALKGRGHDASEFQDAQSAIGASYSGHFLDWLFLVITISGLALWILIAKPDLKAVVRLLLGTIVTFIFIVALQKVNNLIFDPLFDRKTTQNVPENNLLKCVSSANSGISKNSGVNLRFLHR